MTHEDGLPKSNNKKLNLTLKEIYSFGIVTFVRFPTDAKDRYGPHLASSQNPHQSCRENQI